MRLSFAQIGRVFEAYRINDNNQWEKTRQIAYEVWRHGAKNAPTIETYMPLGDEKSGLTEEEISKLHEDREKYKKLDKSVKRKKLFKYVKART